MNDANGLPQSVLVLGGTSTIAVETVRQLVAKRTRKVVLAGRDIDALKDAGSSLAPAEVDVAHFDALDFESHAAFVSEMFDEHGDFDMVLLAFGVLGDQEADEKDASRAVKVIGANFTGAASVLLPLSRRMQKAGHGQIVVLSTVAAERARGANFIYGSSKAGLDAFCQGLNDSLAGKGVTVTVVRPGFVRSKMTEGMQDKPMTTTPEAVAADIVAALPKRPHTVWSPGKLRLVFSVMRHLPRPVFRMIKQ